MTKIYLLSVLLLGASMALCQQPNISWSIPITFNSTNDADQSLITDLATDKDGNTYITGEFQTQISLGNGVLLTGNGSQVALFLAKYNSSGTVLWARKIIPQVDDNSSTFTGTAKIALDYAGNVYWSGVYRSVSLDLGDGHIITRACVSNCFREGFVVKVTANGSIAFKKGVRASPGMDFRIGGIAADSMGNHYLTGNFSGTELWLEGGANLGGITSPGFFLAQYNPEGNAEWIAFPVDNSATPNSWGITISPNGERIAVTGQFTGTELNFGNSAATAGGTGDNQFIVWFNKQGQPVKAGNIEGSSMDIPDMRMRNDFSVWAICNYTGSLKWNGDTINSVTTNINNSAVVNISISNSQPEMKFSFNYAGLIYPVNSIVLDSAGGYYTGGYLKTQPVNIPVIGPIMSSGCSDFLLIHGNANALQWADAIGGSGCEEVSNLFNGSLMDTDASGNLYVAGRYTDGGVIGSNTFNGNGLWLAKIAAGLVAVSEPTSVNSTISPNPSSGLVQFSGTDFSEKNAFISNLLGQTTTIRINQNQLDLSYLPDGIYVIQVENTGHIYRVYLKRM